MSSTLLKDFKSSRYSKPINCMKLKEKDKLIDAFITKYSNVFVTTNKSYGLWYNTSEIPVVGLRTSGVKSINLKDDYVVSTSNFDDGDEYLAVVTDKGTGKRVKLSEFEKTSRAKRGLLILREVKTNPYRTIGAIVVNGREFIGLKGIDTKIIKVTELPIMDRYSTGSVIVKKQVKSIFKNVDLIKRKDIDVNTDISNENPVKKVSLKEIDDRLMTIDDFIDIDV